MPKFFSRFDRPVTEANCAGDRFEPVMSYTIGKDGVKKLVETGEKQDLYGLIQQNAVGVSLAEIVKRCTLLQDESLLMQRPAGFIDATELPTDFMDMQNKIIQARESFMKLSVEVRNQFGNSPDRFISEMFTPRWNEIMGVEIVEPKTETKMEVVENGLGPAAT